MAPNGTKEQQQGGDGRVCSAHAQLAGESAAEAKFILTSTVGNAFTQPGGAIQVSSPCTRSSCHRRVVCFSQNGSGESSSCELPLLQHLQDTAKVQCYAGNDSVRVSFALPYRCTFGQHLCLVGSINPLGAWDVGRAWQCGGRRATYVRPVLACFLT